MDLDTKRQSIEPTYDSRDTGPRYHVTARIGDETIMFQKPIPDPFVRTAVHVSNRWALFRGLLRGRLTVEVVVGGDRQVMDDVLELDSNTLTPNSTRRDEFNEYMSNAVKSRARGGE